MKTPYKLFEGLYNGEMVFKECPFLYEKYLDNNMKETTNMKYATKYSYYEYNDKYLLRVGYQVQLVEKGG